LIEVLFHGRVEETNRIGEPAAGGELATAQEMIERGHGLEGVLEERSGDLYGVVNGIDYEQWNPAKDPALVRPYSADEPEGKTVCREALRRELGLDEGPGPLVTMVTRLAWQKGLDLALESLPGMLEAGCRVALLGSGEAPLEEAWMEAAARNPGEVAVRIGYDSELASRMYAGGDCFLMPSRYEPCGLAQLIALRYGAIPVVRRTGGLADTVREFDATRPTGTGFLFDAYTPEALGQAVSRAVDPERWRRRRRRAPRSWAARWASRRSPRRGRAPGPVLRGGAPEPRSRSCP